MRKIYLDEKNVGIAINWFSDFMKKQYKLHKLQYDRDTKRWVLTLEKIYPGKEEIFKKTDQSESFKVVENGI